VQTKALPQKKILLPYSPLSPFPPCTIIPSIPPIHILTSTPLHLSWQPPNKTKHMPTHSKQPHFSASVNDIVAHHAVQSRKNRMESEQAKLNIQDIQQFIQKLNARVESLSPKEYIPLQRTYDFVFYI
jgi:hypothetical protein